MATVSLVKALEFVMTETQSQDLQAILGSEDHLHSEVDKTKAQYRKQIKALNDEIKALGDENNSLMTKVNDLKNDIFDGLFDGKSNTKQEEIDALQKEVIDLMDQLAEANNTLPQIKANNAPLESWNAHWEQKLESDKQRIWANNALREMGDGNSIIS